jgi:hypothetical protein
MSFFRHGEIYRSDVGPRQDREQLTLCCSRRSSASMSFQSVIPWLVALRQSLPPLYRPETILHHLKLSYSLFFAEFVR